MLLDHRIRDGVGKSALDLACEIGDDEIVDLLLSHVSGDRSASITSVVSGSPTVETDVTSDSTRRTSGSTVSGSPDVHK